jgi:translation initiation factor IF-2
MGIVRVKDQFKLYRKDELIARGSIAVLQLAKAPVSSVEFGNEFGMMLDCTTTPEPGDIIEAFKREIK